MGGPGDSSGPHAVDSAEKGEGLAFPPQSPVGFVSAAALCEIENADYRWMPGNLNMLVTQISCSTLKYNRSLMSM